MALTKEVAMMWADVTGFGRDWRRRKARWLGLWPGHQFMVCDTTIPEVRTPEEEQVGAGVWIRQIRIGCPRHTKRDTQEAGSWLWVMNPKNLAHPCASCTFLQSQYLSLRASIHPCQDSFPPQPSPWMWSSWSGPFSHVTQMCASVGGDCLLQGPQTWNLFNVLICL